MSDAEYGEPCCWPACWLPVWCAVAFAVTFIVFAPAALWELAT